MKELKNRFKIVGLGITLIIGTLLTSCNTEKLKVTPIESFKGTWKLEGRSMFNGIQIKIEENSKGELTGKVIELNNNKYVKMFLETGDTWVSEISRSSNYEFKLTEKKIGSALFSMYGLSTSNEYKVQFIDQNTFGLGSANSNPKESKTKYVRIEKE